MKILITRAEPAASQTAKHLSQAGHHPIVLPLFEIIDTGAPIPQKPYDGIIFTSKNSVETLANRGWQLNNMDIPALCVGEKTEIAAIALGFKKTITAKGGGQALCDKISALDFKNKHFLYPSTPDKSFDMATALIPLEIKVETVDVYQAKKIILNIEAFQETLNQLQGHCIFVYSALSSEHLKTLIENDNTQITKKITLVGISAQATAPLNKFKWKSVLVSNIPTESAMLELIS